MKVIEKSRTTRNVILGTASSVVTVGGTLEFLQKYWDGMPEWIADPFIVGLLGIAVVPLISRAWARFLDCK